MFKTFRMLMYFKIDNYMFDNVVHNYTCMCRIKWLCTCRYVHSHTTNFPTLSLYIMKLWIMNVDTKAKVLTGKVW